MSITVTLARQLSASASLLLGTANRPAPWIRHARAIHLKPHIPEWDEIVKFAVLRPLDDIVASDYRLHQRDATRDVAEQSYFDLAWREQVQELRGKTLAEFRELRWDAWLKGHDPWRFWCCGEAGEELGVVDVNFSRLPQEWEHICKLIGLPHCPLLHLNAA